MLRRALASSRYVVVIAVATTLFASIALLTYEAVVVVSYVFTAVADIVRQGSASSKAAKALAAGIIEMMDVFLIAIVAQIMCLGLYSLFIDDTVPMPQWLKVGDLEDLKSQLVSVVIVVLAVLFLREAVDRGAQLDLLELAASLSLMMAALTFFMATKKGKPP